MINKKNYFINIVEKINNIAIIVASILMALTIMLIFLDVSIRFLPGRAPTIYAVEICGYLLMYFAFLSYAYTDQCDMHISLDILYFLLSEKKIKTVKFINLIINFIVSFFLAVTSFIWVYKCYLIGVCSYTELMVPLWIPRLSIPVGFFLFSLGTIRKIILWFTDPKQQGQTKVIDLDSMPKI